MIAELKRKLQIKESSTHQTGGNSGMAPGNLGESIGRRAGQRAGSAVSGQKTGKSRVGIIVAVTLGIIVLVNVLLSVFVAYLNRTDGNLFEWEDDSEYVEPDGSVELDEDSGYYDAVQLVLERSEGAEDDQAFYDWVYGDVSRETGKIREAAPESFAVVTTYEGRLVIDVYCDEADDDQAIADAVREIDQSIEEKLAGSEYEGVSRAFILEDYDSGQILAVLIDGEPHYAADRFMDVYQ